MSEERRCFNEAPAERGGKPVPTAARSRAGRLASMRPPLNAGENRADRVRRYPQLREASMRPPLNAGENKRW